MLHVDLLHAVLSLALFPIDHIAVVLFLQKKVKQLLLHFPARWITEPTPHFEDNGKSDQHNPGKMANRYHGYFSRITGINSLMQIQQALQTGASFEVHNGFHERNKHVAMSSKLVAFTWGEGDKPKPGGTLQTWRLCKGQKVHISYTTLLKPNIGANNKQKCGQKRECSRSLTSLLVKPSKVYKPSAVLVVEENEEYLRQFEGFDMFSTGEDVH